MATMLITPDQDAVVSEIEIAAPPARIFAALIDPEQNKKWGSNGPFEITIWEMDARPGGQWRFISHERGGKAEFRHHGKVLEIDPPRVLAYTWFANWHENPAMETEVRWELTATSKGTKVKVTHSGLGQDAKARQGYSGGWPSLLQGLQQHFEN